MAPTGAKPSGACSGRSACSLWKESTPPFRCTSASSRTPIFKPAGSTPISSSATCPRRASMAGSRGSAWQPALLCALLGFTWQLLTVHFNYGGNFTALFCTAPSLPIPPQLAREHIYVFPGSGGYDGQYYHYVA